MQAVPSRHPWLQGHLAILGQRSLLAVLGYWDTRPSLASGSLSCTYSWKVYNASLYFLTLKQKLSSLVGTRVYSRGSTQLKGSIKPFTRSPLTRGTAELTHFSPTLKGGFLLYFREKCSQPLAFPLLHDRSPEYSPFQRFIIYVCSMISLTH